MKKLLLLPAACLTIPASASVVVSSPVVVQQKFVDGPLKVGGYAYVKSQDNCCLIVQIQDMVSTGPNNPIWITTFYSDSSGNYPADNAYWRSVRSRFNSSDLQGLQPA